MMVIIRLPSFRSAHALAGAYDLGRRMSASRVWRSVRLAATTILVLWGTRFGVEIPQPGSATGWPQPSSDPRTQRLAAFFKAYNCPQPNYAEEYLRAADRYGLDYRLLPAISIRETTCGMWEENNNRWGYHPGRQRFPSVKAGIDFVARTLASNPPYAGKTLSDKLFTYNPRPAYRDEVWRIMREIE
jgi:hypothetical protein